MDAWIPIATVGALFVGTGLAMLAAKRSPETAGATNAKSTKNGQPEGGSSPSKPAHAKPDGDGANAPKAVAAKPEEGGAEAHNEDEDTFIASRAELFAAKGDRGGEWAAAEATTDAAVSAVSAPAPSAEAAGGEPPKATASARSDNDNDDEARSLDHTGPHPLILLHAIACTDPGLRRQNNEDRYLRLEAPHHVYIVADGMGGHAAGEVASQTAVDTIERVFAESSFPGEPDAARPRRGDELVRAVEAANTAVYEKAQTDDAYEKMGTTLVGARFSPNKREVYIVNVGDSRCYRARSGVLEQMTTDHTLGVMLGIKGREAGRLTRAVGIEPVVEVDLMTDTPRVGDHYLVCSDGLTRMVPDETILSVLSDENDLEKAAQKLIVTANDLGGRDNITVVLLRVLDPTGA